MNKKQKSISVGNQAYKQHFMQKAILLAKKAFKKGEVPIGAVIVKNGKIIASAYNRRNKAKNAILHAEVVAIARACKRVGDWRLNDCEMFVTVLPCPMCAGAIVNSRLEKVFYGATNENKDLFEQIISKSALNHTLVAEAGVCEQECSSLMKQFFASRR